MKNGGEQWQVDDELLTETGRGGLFTDGYLQGQPLVTYFESEERPLFVFGSGKRGVTRVHEGDTERIVPASGYRAITAVTDRRVQFVVGGGSETDGDWAADIRLSDIDRVSVDEGLIRDQLTLSAGGTEWNVYLKDVDTERVTTFLEDVSWAWIQAEERIGDARKRLVDAGQHEKSREYEAADEDLRAARRALDEAGDVADSLAEEAAVGIRERIAQIESRYRETKRRVYASHATHLVDDAERHWRHENFDRAYEAFAAAREQYVTVLDIYGLEPDKAEAMRDRIEHVDRNLEMLATAPLEQAHETRRRAHEAEDAETRLTEWRRALEQYRTVLELDWGAEEKRFAGDIDLLRDRVAEAVDGVLDTRRTLAAEYRAAGDDRIDDGDVSGARESYSTAVDHLEAARALAREFDPEAVDDLQSRLDTLGERISDAATTVNAATTADSDEDDGDDYDDFDNWVTLSPDDDEAESTDDAEATDDETTADEETAGAGIKDGAASVVGADPSPDTEDAPESGDRPGPLTERLTDVDLPLAHPEEGEAAPSEGVVASVRRLERRVLLDVLEAAWTDLGWETSAEEAVVRAERERPTATTLALVPHAGDVTVSDVDACLDYEGVDRVTLVASGDVEAGAQRRANEADVELLDATALAAMLEREDLTDLLPDATA